MPNFECDLMRLHMRRVATEQRLVYDRYLLPFSRDLLRSFRSLNPTMALPNSDKRLANYMLNVSDHPQVEYFLEVYDHWRICRTEFPNSVDSLGQAFYCFEDASSTIYKRPHTPEFQSVLLNTLEDLFNVHDKLRTKNDCLKQRLETLRKMIEKFKLDSPQLLEYYQYDHVTTFMELVVLESSIGLSAAYIPLLKFQMEFCPEKMKQAYRTQLEMVGASAEPFPTEEPWPCPDSEDEDEDESDDDEVGDEEEEDFIDTPLIDPVPRDWILEAFKLISSLHFIGILIGAALSYIFPSWF